MKTNKKAVLGFAVAMVVSLSVMQGNAMKSNKQDVNIQQISIGCAVGAGFCESGSPTQYGLLAASAMAGGYAVNVGSTLSTAAPVSTTNPAGWVGWGSVAVAGL